MLEQPPVHRKKDGLSRWETDQSREHELSHVRDALRGLKFGTVTLIVQDGVVVQIDRTEKRRLRSGKPQPERDK